MKKCLFITMSLITFLFVFYISCYAGSSMAGEEKNSPVPQIEKTPNKIGVIKRDPKGASLSPGRKAPLWDKGQGQALNPAPVIRKMGEGLLGLGNIIINKADGTVMVNGQVNMQKGLVEYLACGAKGKLHESILRLDVDPYYLQIALLLIGLEPGGQAPGRQGDSNKIDGDPVEIWVRWKGSDKKLVKHRAEKLIYNHSAKRPMEKTEWIFTGSQIIDGRFMAQVEHSIVATYHDPFALLDHRKITGADDSIFYANSDLLPAEGTAIEFIIKSKK